LADPALGSKQICPTCQAKFYDLGRRPAHCPKCGSDFDPEEAVKFRRIRARTATPDYETDDEAEDQVKAKAKADEDDLEEEEVAAPEIDEAVDEVLVSDDDDDVEPDAPEAATSEVEIEEDVDLEEDNVVPFLEEDEEGFEEDIEGLPEDGDEDR
jgi:uncharacterized protein (TIGR02300 family)